MGRIATKLRDSLFGLLGQATEDGPSRQNRTEKVREAMLRHLGDHGVTRFPQLTRRIQFATDAEALWYLRSDLMASLANLHGESFARHEMQELTDHFHGLVSQGLTRPSTSSVGKPR
jgi:hypothetical protein